MKKAIVVLAVLLLAVSAFGYPRQALVERFTNASCAPCASVNTGWYTATVQGLENAGSLDHIVYNVNWPGPNDPMYLFNASDNMARRALYGVNSVPWIEVDGSLFNMTGSYATDAANFDALITGLEGSYSPFDLQVTALRYTSGVVEVEVAVTRDPSDATVLPAEMILQVGLVENLVVFASPPGSNGESQFHDVCRRMLPDAGGNAFSVPAPGGSTVISLSYVPDAEALSTIVFEDLSVVAFVEAAGGGVSQSRKEPTVLADTVHAAFRVDETVGGAPMQVVFTDMSSPAAGSAITSWTWDLDGNGTVDSTDPSPTWTYAAQGLYTVSLTVTDGTGSDTSTRTDLLQVIANQANVLVVNGIEYATYAAEMEAFYAGAAVHGSHPVDVWDVFGDQGFDYGMDSGVMATHLFRGRVPDSVMGLYDTVIWVGNNYGGDLDAYDAAQALAFVQGGGNFILATRMGTSYFDITLRNYCGILSISNDRTVTNLVSLDPALGDVPAAAGSTYANFAYLGASSEALPMFREATDTTYIAAFRIRKAGHGTFVYVAGRPYRYDAAASAANYEVMLGSWLLDSTAVEGGLPGLALAQNSPNPFNPSTEIRFTLAQSGRVNLRVFDAAGRLVRTLVDGDLPADTHAVNWDGRADDGGRAAAGVYLYRLETPEGVLSRSMVMVK